MTRLPQSEIPPPTPTDGNFDQVRRGEPEAFDRLFAGLYVELRREAHRRRRSAHAGDTLSTTALVHETYLKLNASDKARWQDRAHFFAVAARAMRQIVIDDARRRLAGKRGGGGRPIELGDGPAIAARDEQLLALDEALAELEGLDPRMGRVVELRYFAGLSVEEAAEALGISPRTIKREWQKARAFLHRRLEVEPVSAAAL